MIYLNNAATTKIDDDILQTYVDVSKKYYSSPSTNYEALNLQNQCRESILKNLMYTNKKVVFTSNATFANNLAILGYARSFKHKKHFITSIYEHASVYETFKQLEDEGHEVSYVFPNENGIVCKNDIINLIKKDTVMVSIMCVNNELGTHNEIDFIFDEIKKINSNIVVMSDCVQAIGKVKMPSDRCDIVTFSTHKIHGPKNIGVLIINDKINLSKITYGGSNEFNINPGTLDLALVVCLTKTINKSINALDETNKHFNVIGQRIYKRIAQNSNLGLNCISNTNVFSIRLNSIMNGQSICDFLFNLNIEVSTRSACSVRVKSDYRVLKSIGLSSSFCDKTIRISISKFTTIQEIDHFFDILEEKIEWSNDESYIN